MSRKIYNLGKVKGRTPEFRLAEKILEVKYDDETVWSTLVDFSTIASSFDLRLNEETFFLEAQREVDGGWEEMVDLSALKLAHEHSNKDVLDKITSGVYTNLTDAVSKRHKHENADYLDQINDEHIQSINQIPVIQEEISEFAPPQLVEGLVYTDKNTKGLSANRNAMPTADYVWIEGKASNIQSLDETIESATLKVVTTSGVKSSTTTININIVCANLNTLDKIQTQINSRPPYMTVVFEDEPDKKFYIKCGGAISASEYSIDLSFTFVDGYETFPVSGNITRSIQSICLIPINGIASHIEGCGTLASSDYSHVQGRYNIEDINNEYAHIVGNGTSGSRSNAHTLDWDGNAWYAGSVEGTAFILSSSTEGSIKRFVITVDDAGVLTATEITG